jgi:2,3-dihydroxybenzoate decarboxylase
MPHKLGATIDMRIITIEEHYWYRPLSERTDIAHYFEQMHHPACNKLGDVGSQRIAEMDKNGIDYQILSHFDPGAQELDGPDAVTLAREANDMLGDATKKNPDRLGGFATLATQEPKAAAEELERTVRQYGFKGAMINGHTHGEYLDDPKFWIILEVAEALGVPIYLHPTTPPPEVMKAYYNNYLDEGLHLASWGFGVESGTHALRLIYSGALDRFPNLNIILGHMGELLPFQMWRLDRYYMPTAWWKPESLKAKSKLKRSPSQYIRDQFYVTTSGNFSYPALLCTMLELGADRILFAVDYPMDENQAAVQFLKTVPISQDDREKIAHKNAERLLNCATQVPAGGSSR